MKRILFFFCVICCKSALGQVLAIPRDSTYNVATVLRQIAKNFPYAVPAKDSMPAEVKARRNLVYATLLNTPFGKRELHLDVFSPVSKEKRPAILMIHGGGWRSGTKEMQVPMAQMLAAKGFVAIPVEYQLSLEARYPAAVHNIKSAIRWVRLHAKEYDIDTSRIAISGCSAGGQLASLVGLTNFVDLFKGEQGNVGASSAVAAIIDIDGVLDFMAPNSLNLDRKSNSPDVEWLGGTFETKPLIWKQASSIFWAREKTAIPMLFINSGFSRFHAGQDELTGMLKEWHVSFEVQKFDVQVHPFWLFHPWVDTTVNCIAAFLTKVYAIK